MHHHRSKTSPHSRAASAADARLLIEPRRSPRLIAAFATWLAGLAALLLFATGAPVALRVVLATLLVALTQRSFRTHFLLQGPKAVRRLTLLRDNHWVADLANGEQCVLCVRGSSASLGPIAWLHLVAVEGPRRRTVVVLDEASLGASAFRALRRWLRLGPARRFEAGGS